MDGASREETPLFAKVDPQADFVALEHEVLSFWEREKIFRRLVSLRGEQRGGMDPPRWSFLDGPITANNPMGVHHAWGRAYKDVQQRYRAMRGFNQRWQNGFDCQGLWVEVNVEKELGFRSKRDIEALGMERFILLCKQRVLTYAAMMTEQSIRLGQWMRWDDPELLRFLRDRLGEDPRQVVTVRGYDGTEVAGAVEQVIGRLGSRELGGSYFTFSDENNYCIWTFLKRCHERGWIYKGRDVVPWCARCGTAISHHEMETEGYQERTHQAVYVRFPLTTAGKEGEGLLVWTTTPWTLTSNVAVAVGPEIEYARIRQAGDVSYVAVAAIERAVTGEYDVLETLPGRKMLDWTYRGPFDDLPAVREVGADSAHRVIPWSEVGADEGTGMVHIAPGCGAEDFQLGKLFDLPAVAPLDENGIYLPGFGDYTGEPVGTVAPAIVRELRERGFLYRAESYTHRYPTCWRCAEELVFRLVDEWFISMGPAFDRPYAEVTPDEKAASLRYQIMDLVHDIRWIPAFGFEREMDWLRNMQDWMISKKRYWGLALPIWECAACRHFDVVGSEEELRQRAVAGWERFEGHSPHRPHVDAVRIRCERCGEEMDRIPDVGNPWLDAGIVAFSTLEWRREPGYWNEWFPAEFITESFPGQFRNWFYSLLTMSTVLAGRVPFRSVLGFATLMGEDGKPMHKSGSNFIDFNEGAEQIGVDVMRWMYVSQRPEANLLFGWNTAREARRQFLIPLWNCYALFANYAVLDAWNPSRRSSRLSLLDRWLAARLRSLVREVTAALDDYDHVAATQALSRFVDQLSNWYLRRSRRRFWKSEADDDKLAAYSTLYDALLTVSRLLAPLLPFVTETMYANLARRMDPAAPPSVHLCDWPPVEESPADEQIVRQMDLAIDLAEVGRAARAAGGLRIRQPISRVRVFVAPDRATALPEELLETVRDELNVKRIEFVRDVGELATYRVLPNNQILGPRHGSDFPAIRQALLALDPAVVAQQVLAGGAVTVAAAGREIDLAPEEIVVQTEPRSGLAVASERGVTVGADTELTPGLLREGAARDIVRQIQSLRKELDLEMNQRIRVRYQAAGEATEAVREHRDYIMSETLSTSFEPGEIDGCRTDFTVLNEPVAISIAPA